MPNLRLVEKQLCDLALQILRESEDLQNILFGLKQQACEAHLQVRVDITSEEPTRVKVSPKSFPELINRDDENFLADLGVRLK